MQQRILYLVDDDDDDRMFIKGAVQAIMENIDILEYTNGVDFLEKLKRDTVQPGCALLLMDMNMPRMTGVEVIQVLKTDPELCNIPVIMISTSASTELKDQAYAAGAAGYLIKPSSAHALSETAAAVKGYFGTLC
jgi:CheY-like chemotaxis protein